MLCGSKLIKGSKFIICNANRCKDKKNKPRFKIPLDCTPHNIDRMFHEGMIYCYTCAKEVYKDDAIIRCIDGCESLVTFNDLEGNKKLTMPNESLIPTSHESEAKPETSSRRKVNETSVTKPKRSSATDTAVPSLPAATMQKSNPKDSLRTMLEESATIQAAVEPPKPETKHKQPRQKTSDTIIKHSYTGQTKPIQSSVDKEKTKQSCWSTRQNAKPLDKMPSRTSSKSNVLGLKEVVSDPLSSETISRKIDSGGEDSFTSKLYL